MKDILKTTKQTILNYYLIQQISLYSFFKHLNINVCKLKIVRNSEFEIIIPAKYAFVSLYYLKNDSTFRCDILSDIIATDFIKYKNRFLISYLLLSSFNYRIRVTTKIKECENILSIISIFSSSL